MRQIICDAPSCTSTKVVKDSYYEESDDDSPEWYTINRYAKYIQEQTPDDPEIESVERLINREEKYDLCSMKCVAEFSTSQPE